MTGTGFNRCRDSTSFFKDFYTTFFETNPGFSKMFSDNLERQYYLLRESLDLILQFPAERPIEPTILTKVAESHRDRNIRPAFYDLFLENLIKTLKIHDPLFLKGGHGPGVEEAWRATVKPAIDYMKSRATAP